MHVDRVVFENLADHHFVLGAHLSELGRIVLQHLDDLTEQTDRRLLQEPKMMDAERRHNPLLKRRIVRH